jgi:hypothetical protein
LVYRDQETNFLVGGVQILSDLEIPRYGVILYDLNKKCKKGTEKNKGQELLSRSSIQEI